jgi:hypothetical protein
MDNLVKPGVAMLRVSRWAVVVGIVAVAALCSRMIAGKGIEDEIKAEFIERLARFIEWPAGSAEGSAFVIGVLGDGPIEEALKGVAARSKVKGKPIEIRSFSDVDSIGGCQILFITRSQRHQLSEILARVQANPILTVGDGEGLAQLGVMINFFETGDFIRFEINNRAADKVGLKIAAELLALGEVVE